MTYFAFLAIFLGIPMILMSAAVIRQHRTKWLPSALAAWRPWVVMLGLCVVAFIYTTPWDHYLVATGVWWYDPALVTGIVIGYVPVEEYTFFLLLPIASSLFAILLMCSMPFDPQAATNTGIRIAATLVALLIWGIHVVLLILSFTDPANFRPFTYLSLEIVWAFIPIMVQLAFGADILWRHRRMVLTVIALATLYYSATDAIAIAAGTWTIDPAQSLSHIKFGGILPFEEFIFFLLVNVLVVFGLTLVLAEESQGRALALRRYTVFRPFIDWLMKRSNHITLEGA